MSEQGWQTRAQKVLKVPHCGVSIPGYYPSRPSGLSPKSGWGLVLHPAHQQTLRRVLGMMRALGLLARHPSATPLHAPLQSRPAWPPHRCVQKAEVCKGVSDSPWRSACLDVCPCWLVVLCLEAFLRKRRGHISQVPPGQLTIR
ncbi:hypothetical protein MAPG_08681 [Magnaporthiopsis poae ATCC 64411]|uniref:Uncharacterized protein n=1 Tax=Magnaporthiopsis poae (strain ATCC 64411 / 73-15) TaxID=644358 RepID=A0A0C4E7Z7_MAGP6|nr:hypothetical protein MAPG_08681 [Magnaporthiopsis poae ATCC 64411]